MYYGFSRPSLQGEMRDDEVRIYDYITKIQPLIMDAGLHEQHPTPTEDRLHVHQLMDQFLNFGPRL